MINEEIRDKEVRLIGSEGEQLGIVSAAEAQKLADEKNLDLVKIAPQAKPPVCKIMDYGKHKFEIAKREIENRKNQTIFDIDKVGKKIYNKIGKKLLGFWSPFFLAKTANICYYIG